MQCGMFKRMIAPRFKNEGQFEKHVMIIHARGDGCHAENGVALISFNQNLYKLRCNFAQIRENMITNTTSRRLLRKVLFRVQTCGTVNNEAAMAVQIKKSHMPKNSVFFEKIIPIVLITLGVITLGLMIFAASVLLGFVQF